MVENRRRVLVVDDESSIRDSLRLLLNQSFEVNTAKDGLEALDLVDEFAPDLVLLDIIMPNLDGIETLKQLRERDANLPVIMLTATNTVKTAVEAMKCGAADYLSKPFDVADLTERIFSTLEKIEDEDEEVLDSQTLPDNSLEADFGAMVGRSPEMQSVFDRISQISATQSTVLITGESGTGKELVARRIHELSSRYAGPFVPINCSAIPETLIESELFGHEKGSFTNAIERRIGHFELARGGTLFLDEIGELSLPVQVKMLRFLQEHEFYRVGCSKPIKVDVRVIAATNKNLETLISEGKFRQDLFYRINVISINAPPLRERFEDIPHLCNFFVKRFSRMYGGREIRFANDAQKVLREYPWPGNVRELENVIESLMALASEDEIAADELPARLLRPTAVESTHFSIFDGNMKFEEAERIFETEMIQKALRKTNYVQTRAAELLGISRRILKYKMDKLGISESAAQPENVEAAPAVPQN